MTNRAEKSLLALCGAALSLLLLSAPARAQKLVIAWTPVSAFNSPFWIMPEVGFYKQEGFDVDTIFILSSPTL